MLALLRTPFLKGTDGFQAVFFALEIPNTDRYLQWEKASAP